MVYIGLEASCADLPVTGSSSSVQAIDFDKAAAHEFLSELNTRIATQPLPYQ
jgi:hypothetical protein